MKLLLEYIYTGEITATRSVMEEFENCLKDLGILGTHSYTSSNPEQSEDSVLRENAISDYEITELKSQEEGDDFHNLKCEEEIETGQSIGSSFEEKMNVDYVNVELTGPKKVENFHRLKFIISKR